MRPPARPHQPLSLVHGDRLEPGLAALIDGLAALAAEQYLAQVGRTDPVGREPDDQTPPPRSPA